MTWTREQMAQRAASELRDGQVINLGIGIPTLVANYIGDRRVLIHSENGLLGMGPFPLVGSEDPQLINAGKQTVTVVEGGSTFDSTLSFAMIRGKHIDVAILGAMQVAHNGDIANWSVPGEKMTGMGGAMDLVSGAKRVICLMTHTDKEGRSKLVQSCTLPLTGLGAVDRVITDLGIFDVLKERGAFQVVELAQGVSEEEVRAKTQGLLVMF
jgi:3-oxoacid CoA-transferase subunit B